MKASSEGSAAGAIEAVVFDMDGVVTDTAEAHFQSWKTVFDGFLERYHPDARPFTRRDYLDHVDGIPRYDGVRRFLASRGIELPEGDPEAVTMTSIRGLGNLKNARFRNWLKSNEAPVFDDAIDLIGCLRKSGLAIGVFSASRNARAVLKSAGITDLFDAVVDGHEAAELHLAPKPDPAELFETVKRLGAPPARAIVVEDAVAGVKASARGHFSTVVGVNRQQDGADEQRFQLRAAGADLVTADLRRLSLPGRTGLRTLARLPRVWEREQAFKSAIAGRPPSVFLDFDGTLSPIVADYRTAKLADGMAEAIRALARDVPVAVISGRNVDDVRHRVGIDDVIYAGSHGFDIAGPGGLAKRPDAALGFLAPLDAAEKELRAAIAQVRGAEIERKTFSIAVHYRQVAESDTERLEEAVDAVVERHEKLRKGRGKKVFQVQPRVAWDKGCAVSWLLAETHLGASGRVPIYVGDDLTDEDAFAAIASRGVSIAVRGGEERPTLADFTLEDTTDVRQFLEWLVRSAVPSPDMEQH
jgi:alpha,alpha-trehalase